MSRRPKITLPPSLSGALALRPRLNSAVSEALAEFGKWLDTSGMPFFPEYTEHGTNHVVSVVQTAWWCLTADAHATIQPEDVAVLVLAALFHDSAMHLSEHGFETLLGNDLFRKPLRGYREPSWPSLWAAFEAEAVRWDERQCIAVYGEPEPLHAICREPLRMSKKDALTIGAFLRRHHHRLAHEMAVRGVPGPDGLGLPPPAIAKAILFRAGLVARSHGLSLRAAIDEARARKLLKGEEERTAVLMASLRIADFLDIRPRRSPRQLLLTRRLSSHQSELEHRANRSVRGVRVSAKHSRGRRGQILT